MTSFPHTWMLSGRPDGSFALPRSPARQKRLQCRLSEPACWIRTTRSLRSSMSRPAGPFYLPGRVARSCREPGAKTFRSGDLLGSSSELSNEVPWAKGRIKRVRAQAELGVQRAAELRAQGRVQKRARFEISSFSAGPWISARWNLQPYVIGPAHIQRILQAPCPLALPELG